MKFLVAFNPFYIWGLPGGTVPEKGRIVLIKAGDEVEFMAAIEDMRVRIAVELTAAAVSRSWEAVGEVHIGTITPSPFGFSEVISWFLVRIRTGALAIKEK